MLPHVIDERERGEEHAHLRTVELRILQHGLIDALVEGTGFNRAGFHSLFGRRVTASIAEFQSLLASIPTRCKASNGIKLPPVALTSPKANDLPLRRRPKTSESREVP